jgi:hypothetical protein
MSLKIKRGTNSERLTIVPDEGELIYTTDTKKLFVGDGTTTGGNVASNAFQGTINDDILFSTYNINGTNISINGASGAITANTVKADLIDDSNRIIVRNDLNQNRITLYGYNVNGVSVGSGFGDPPFISYNALLPQQPTSRHFTSRGTWSAKTATQNNDILWGDLYFGHNGTAYSRAVSIYVNAGTVNSFNKVPGNLTIRTADILQNKDNVFSFNSEGVAAVPILRITEGYSTSPDDRPGAVGVVMQPARGMIIFETTTNTFQGWNGTSWVTLG